MRQSRENDNPLWILNFQLELLGHGEVAQWVDLVNFLYSTLPVSFGRDAKAVGPFYLVSMPEEVKDPTQGINV